MFHAFDAHSNPKKQEFLFPFQFEEAMAKDSGHFLKVIVFNSNPPHQLLIFAVSCIQFCINILPFKI